MKAIRISQLLKWGASIALVAVVSVAAEKNPLAHVDIKTVKSYDGQKPLPKPDRVIVYDFTVTPDIVKTDRTPGIHQRMNGDSKEEVGEQVEDQITSDLFNGLQKQLKLSGIPVEKGTPGMQAPGNALTIHGTVTKLDEGHRLRRGTVGLGAGASDVEADCQISVETGANSVLFSELSTVAKSGKKPGAAVTMGAGAAPEVAGGVTGATAHSSTAQGDSARTGSALARHIAGLMTAQGWVAADQQALTETKSSQ
jgi:hypothetical protein